MTRWRFALLFVPAAIACWGIGHVAGVKDGTGGSLADGYGGGFAVTMIIIFSVGLYRRRREGSRIDVWRIAAFNVRVNEPQVYEALLAHSRTDPDAAASAANDPDAYVALLLSFMADEGLSLDEIRADVYGAVVEDTDDPHPTSSWPYEVLGVRGDATAQDIKRAYRALIQHFHPDHNPNDVSAAERFQAIQAAYEELGKP